MYYVYILRCSDDTLYCGYTNDLQNRIATHNAKKGAKYTRGRLPVKLVYFEEYIDKSDALKREHKIKTYNKKQKLDLINKKIN